MNKLIKQLEKQNIFISIVFQRNANREKQWYFVIDDLENQIYKSSIYSNKKLCKKEALNKGLSIDIPEYVIANNEKNKRLRKSIKLFLRIN